MKITLLLASALVLSVIITSRVYPVMAHEEVVQGDIQIVAGWVNEPPVVGQFNGIELRITRVSDGQPVNNALAQLDVSVKKGAPTKSLDFQPDRQEAGLYAADILPSQTGQYTVIMRGTIAGQAIDSQIEIQDVSDTAVFAFPPSTSGGPIQQEVIDQLQTVISDLASQVDEANVVAEDAKTAAADATKASADLKMAADRAYLFGMIGVGVGVAGIAIGVAALSRRGKA